MNLSYKHNIITTYTIKEEFINWNFQKQSENYFLLKQNWCDPVRKCVFSLYSSVVFSAFRVHISYSIQLKLWQSIYSSYQ